MDTNQGPSSVLGLPVGFRIYNVVLFLPCGGGVKSEALHPRTEGPRPSYELLPKAM